MRKNINIIKIDYRERGSGVIQALKRKGSSYEIVALNTGDYIIDGKIYIERKTSHDFIVSLKSGRLFKQIAGLKKCGQRQLMIIEGLPLNLIKGTRPQALKGALVAITVSWQLPILFSECPEETAEILDRIQKQIIKSSRNVPRKIYLKKKSKQPPVQRKKILEAMPTIGPHLAEELLNKFGSLEGIFNASEEDLEETKGIGKIKAGKIKDILREHKFKYRYK